MRWRGPADAAPWQAFFGCPVRFGADDDALTFRRDVLDLPLPEHTPELAEMFGSYAAALVRHLKPETSFVDQVREALAEGC